MISEEQAESAVTYYGLHAAELGQLRGAVEAAKHRAKTLERVEFLASTGTVAEREAKAGTSTDAQAAWDEYHNAIADYETLRTNLKAAELRIDVYRTQQANNRRGHV